jgi:hypothetical protein
MAPSRSLRCRLTAYHCRLGTVVEADSGAERGSTAPAVESVAFEVAAANADGPSYEVLEIE